MPTYGGRRPIKFECCALSGLTIIPVRALSSQDQLLIQRRDALPQMYSRVQNEVPLLFIGRAGTGSALAAAAWYC